MIERRSRRAVAAGLALLALITTACSRDDGETEVGAATTAAPSGTDGSGDTTAPAGGGGLDNGGFGDIETVCQDGDASGATDVGVTDDSIQVGVFTDKGFSARPGLNEEMYDAAVAFAEWCNAHGGILGRDLIIADRDAALTDFNARIIDSCAQDFAMVGGGAVLDDADNGGRIQCGLPNIAGYVVSLAARDAELQVQPVPNAVGKLAIGAHQRIAEEFPDLIDSYGVLTSSFGSVLAVRDETVTALTSEGWEVVYSEEYNSAGESNWRPFVEQMRDSGVEIFELVGEPTFFTQILEAMEAVGWRPQVMIQNTNFYDRTFAENAGDIAENVHIRSQYTPFELADQNQATADYLELLEASGGKVAQLGMQSMSAFLLFAQAATACGSELTRECLLEQAGSVEEWTGGGLHAPQDLAGDNPSPCFLILDLTPEGFVYNEELTAPTDGLFNCEPDNVFIADG